MLNKILVWGGLALTAILVIENLVVTNRSFLFISTNTYSWQLAIAATIIGIGIGYGLKNMLNKEKGDDDEYNF